jgi:AcrR family transcriptional regulator
MAQHAPAPRPRRTQEQRSATTRAALLDATLQTLVEVGYASTTTSRVAARAGVSRGAHLHHFQTRAALVSAALERYADRRADELRREVAALPPGDDRTGRALDLLWGLYTSPLFQGAVDLWAAARTDADLRAELAPLERTLARETVRLCRDLFAEHAGRPDFDVRMEMVLSAIRGLALLEVVQPGSGASTRQWERGRGLLLGLLAG